MCSAENSLTLSVYRAEHPDRFSLPLGLSEAILTIVHIIPSFPDVCPQDRVRIASLPTGGKGSGSVATMGGAEMEDALHKIQTWAGHGTVRQFLAEISGKIAGGGYEVAIDGEALVCSRVRKEGGFLGIGAKKISEPVLRIEYEDGLAKVASEPVDAEFVSYLSGLLGDH